MKPETKCSICGGIRAAVMVQAPSDPFAPRHDSRYAVVFKINEETFRELDRDRFEEYFSKNLETMKAEIMKIYDQIDAGKVPECRRSAHD